ncbi:MAG TPA: hypothetical protein VL282_19610 [Tepidisphaeraceae bacterium]|nr:hypothetical protein [Tepidisphaeraceae bacterium]
MRMFSSDSHDISHGHGSGEHVSRALIWMPLLVGGLLTAMLTSRRSPLRGWFDRWVHFGTAPNRDVRTDAASFLLLRNAIVGNNKTAVAAVFGTPSATAGGFLTGHYHQADTWYYPLSRAQRSALVIQFENGIARDAECILAPRSDN